MISSLNSLSMQPRFGAKRPAKSTADPVAVRAFTDKIEQVDIPRGSAAEREGDAIMKQLMQDTVASLKKAVEKATRPNRDQIRALLNIVMTEGKVEKPSEDIIEAAVDRACADAQKDVLAEANRALASIYQRADQ